MQHILMLCWCLKVMVEDSSREGYLPVLNSWRAQQLQSKLDDVFNGCMNVAFYQITPENWFGKSGE